MLPWPRRASYAGAGAKVLRYVSQRTDKAYLREGPTYAHKVLWVYRHRGYPFAVIAQFDIWRRVRTADGTVGWMSASMLSDQRTVLVTGKGRVKITADADGGKVVALADPGAIARSAEPAPATPAASRAKASMAGSPRSASGAWSQRSVRQATRRH